MTYEEIHALGNCIDGVYNNYSQDGAKKVTAKLDNHCLTLTYQTVVHIARDQGMHLQTPRLKDESSQMIRSRLNLIKKEFKECCDRTLKAKKINSSDFFETISTSPYTPKRIIKYSMSVSYEID
tara:strand:- start:2640 stop:3011 length:372 start_codon:yes stop_codon:yes gene_type:complete